MKDFILKANDRSEIVLAADSFLDVNIIKGMDGDADIYELKVNIDGVNVNDGVRVVDQPLIVNPETGEITQYPTFKPEYYAMIRATTQEAIDIIERDLSQFIVEEDIGVKWA